MLPEQDLKVGQVTPELQGILELKEHQVWQVILEQLDTLVIKVLQE